MPEVAETLPDAVAVFGTSQRGSVRIRRVAPIRSTIDHLLTETGFVLVTEIGAPLTLEFV